MSYFIEDLIAVSSGAMAACAAGPWTKVEDSLPDDPGRYLTIDDGYDEVRIFEGGAWRDFDGNACDVTHWAEIRLPEGVEP